MATFPRSVLITGANRGLGLEFVRQMLELNDAPSVLFATCRNPDEAQDLKKNYNHPPKIQKFLLKNSTFAVHKI